MFFPYKSMSCLTYLTYPTNLQTKLIACVHVRVCAHVYMFMYIMLGMLGI